MKKLLSVMSLLIISLNASNATVGGDQKLEFLGYESTDQKVYLLRHYEDGRGRLPQLYYFDLKSKNPNKLVAVHSIYRNPRTGKIDIDQYEDNSAFSKQLTIIKSRLQPLQKIAPSAIKLTYLSQQQKQITAWFDNYDDTKPESQKQKIAEYHYRYRLSSDDAVTKNLKAKKLISQPQTAVSYRKGLAVNQAFVLPKQQKIIVSIKYLGDQFETVYHWEDAVLLEKSN